MTRETNLGAPGGSVGYEVKRHDPRVLGRSPESGSLLFLLSLCPPPARAVSRYFFLSQITKIFFKRKRKQMCIKYLDVPHIVPGL